MDSRPAATGWPCLDFDHHDPAFIEDPEQAFSTLRQHCPATHSEHHGGFWVLSRYDDVRAAFRDWRTYTSSVVGGAGSIPPAIPREQPHMPMEIDPPLHGRYRALISPAFVTSAIDDLEAPIHEAARSLLGAVRDAGGGDVVSEVTAPLSGTTLALFMGLPAADQRRWVDWVRRMFAGTIGDSAAAQQASAEYVAYIDDLIASRRAEPTGDLISRLVASEVDGHVLTDEEIRGFCVLLLVAGHETTASAMSSSVLHLARYPEDRERLAGDPGLVPGAVEELLRLYAPLQLFGRTAATDTDAHGQQITAGESVALAIGSANLDETIFPDPQEFQPGRSPNRHLAFGFGPHMCVGAHLARLELRVFLSELLTSVPSFRLASNDPPRWGPRGDIRGLDRLAIDCGPTGSDTALS